MTFSFNPSLYLPATDLPARTENGLWKRGSTARRGRAEQSRITFCSHSSAVSCSDCTMANTNIMNDFPLSQKRHVAPQSNLGPGLTPQQEHSNGIPHLTRSRVAHDGAEMAEDPNMWVTQQAKERQAQESPM